MGRAHQKQPLLNPVVPACGASSFGQFNCPSGVPVSRAVTARWPCSLFQNTRQTFVRRARWDSSIVFFPSFVRALWRPAARLLLPDESPFAVHAFCASSLFSSIRPLALLVLKMSHPKFNRIARPPGSIATIAVAFSFFATTFTNFAETLVLGLLRRPLTLDPVASPSLPCFRVFLSLFCLPAILSFLASSPVFRSLLGAHRLPRFCATLRHFPKDSSAPACYPAFSGLGLVAVLGRVLVSPIVFRESGLMIQVHRSYTSSKSCCGRLLPTSRFCTVLNFTDN